MEKKSFKQRIDDFFAISSRNSTVLTEIVAGIVNGIFS